MMRLAGWFLGFAAPAAVLAAAYAVVRDPALLPRPIAGAVTLAPYAALAVAAALGFAFHRGRIVFAALALAIAYGAARHYSAGDSTGFAARLVFAALCVLAPAVLAGLAWLEERGTASVHALPRLGVIAAACALPALIATTGRAAAVDLAFAPLIDGPLLFATPIPQLGIAAIAASLAAIATAAVTRRSVVIGGLGWALIAFAAALHGSTAKLALPVFVTAGGALLGLAVLLDSYRMAFRDELTGLPSRRALDETLQAAGRRYAIAMVDVDRFKKFNDIHGHQVGDQVLRLVASRLARVGGGGRAFRYGGEEFTIVFPGKSVEDAAQHLEQVRAEIEGYRMAIRSPDRPARKRTARRRRSSARAGRTVGVTVSIGVAERRDGHRSSAAVIKAADRALYRAKRRGRNRVMGDG